LNGCGDNVRNVMGCPLSHHSRLFDANAWAQKAGKYFRLPTASYIEVFELDPTYLRKADEEVPEGRFAYGPNLLNRKFKIAFSAVHLDPATNLCVPDNCVEMRTDDIGVAPIAEDGRVARFQVYIGGSQGERNGHPTFSALGQPLGIFDERDLLEGLDAIAAVHRDWGDRQNRHWARLKYVLHKMGIEWYRQQVREYAGTDFSAPDPHLEYGPRRLHYGWTRQEDNGLWAYGAFIENGRIIDGPNGRLKEMVRSLMDVYEIQVLTTPNQDLLFTDIPDDARTSLEADLRGFGYGFRRGRPYSELRSRSGACVGRDTCRLTYTDSERFEPELIDALEARWGDLAESIGVTGCERQCSRPGTKTIGWVGTGLNLYMLKLGGTEDARYQGGPLIDPGTHDLYLRSVSRKDVPTVTDALFEMYVARREPEEARPGGMGYFFRRIGPTAIIAWLRGHPKTAALMEKPWRDPSAVRAFQIGVAISNGLPAAG
jgi:sulfite reductase (NADPH) hemoprotein beta-component